MKKNIRALVAYEGTRYFGWQKTSEGPSIQEALEHVLAVLLRRDCPAEAASRTDAGVHARGQVVNFFVDEGTNLGKLHHGMNSLLKRDIVVQHLEEAPSQFHPTLEAKAKEYHYEVVYEPIQPPFSRHFSWHYPSPLDLGAMQQAASHLIGTHDFSSFCNDRNLLDIDPFCSLYSLTVEQPQGCLGIKIRALGNRFLYRMVRNLAGTLVYVGCGKLRSEAIPEILQAKNRTLAGITAPAKGLFLHKVFYEPVYTLRMDS